MYEYLFIIICFIFVFYILNKQLNTTIERYGVYCGRYNLNRKTAEKLCSKDTECIWNNYTSKDGVQTGWCGQNPKGDTTINSEDIEY